MKKIFILGMCLLFILLTGCEQNSNLVSSLTKKINGLESYALNGELEIINGETSYLYSVKSSSLKGKMFKVDLKNKVNNHEQIMLKNETGVYVLNPVLNKSFKFQSEWPYNNSQAYLLETLLKDIKADNERKIEQDKEGYIITVKANYTNNKELVKEKIYLNEKKDIYKVEVLDDDGISRIIMKITDLNMNAKLDEKDFELEQNMVTSTENDTVLTTIKDITYPMYLPDNINLVSEDKVKTTSGERVILTFGGENNITIVEENVKPNKEYKTINVDGEPIFLGDTIGSISDGVVNWISNGIEYYAVSNDLEDDELINVARSISNIALNKPVNKTLEK